ncbi:hypothetical protein L3X38_033893 [Prunus dulcis]|uniref:Uncharacterized protein n=1 Tax=Prunus dulcis TaxID=3755 RepID=A0AAD4YXC6_PRUDU|nr:hypothetical protein L3X38_033893 [Prunus dulcis]
MLISLPPMASKIVDAQNGPATIESNLVIRCARSSAEKRAEALGEMGWEVKVGALHKVPMWDFVQAVVVATCVLEISRFDAGSARPRKCVFLRHGRRRGCLGASCFDAGSARFIMV